MRKAPAAVGVPLSVPVPLPSSRNVTPAGKGPLSVMLGVGDPVVVTVNVPAAPAWNEAEFALVITIAVSTVREKLCAAFVLTPSAALKAVVIVDGAGPLAV